MKKEIKADNKTWELIEHFKYSDKAEGFPIFTNYLINVGAKIEEFNGNKYFIINNQKHIALLYNRGGGLYREVIETGV